MKPPSKIKFSKMHHIGNDFIVVDFRGHETDFYKTFSPGFVRKICDRNFGVGADGVVGLLSDGSDGLVMEIINSDGSFAMMCGNGLACLALFAAERGAAPGRSFPVDTRSGMRDVSVSAIKNGRARVAVGMGRPETAAEKIPVKTGMIEGARKGSPVIGKKAVIAGKEFRVNLVSMGNPHCVIFSEKPPGRREFEKYGPLIENADLFPDKTNVEFAALRGDGSIDVLVWERGAGPTKACGTGACAVAYSSYLNGFTGEKVVINLPGGSVAAEIKNGPAINLRCEPVFVYEGEMSLF